MDSNLIYILVAVALIVAVGGYIFVRSRPAVEEEYLHFNCPSCGRRLRYRSKQAGHQGACPRCRESFVFPMTPKPAGPR